MADAPRHTGWFSERVALVTLALLSGFLAALVVLPYLQYVLLAVVVAYVLDPVHRTLENYLSPFWAAVTLTAVAMFAVIVPVAYFVAIAIEEGLEFLAAFQEGAFDIEDLETRFEAVGIPLELDDLYSAYREPITAGLQGVATDAFDIVGGLPEVAIGLTVTVFVLFSLLRDGDRFVTWILNVLPFQDEISRELLVELDRLMWASVVGNAAVAGIQAVLLGTGLALLDVPGLVFLTVATFVFALLPLIGTFAVWLPVSVSLFLVGRPVAGGLLFGYGLLVSTVDNYLRPVVIGHSGELNVAIIVVGIFGGVAVFGIVGLFIGPVILGCAKVVLDVFATG